MASALDIIAMTLGPSKYPRGASSWMQDNLSWLGERPIKEVLCLPGAHDAGMFENTHLTDLATADNTITQVRSIYEQLQFGIRWFDVRPMLKGSEFFCGHAGQAGGAGWQGGLGCSLNRLIREVNQFTRQNKELIVLRITHIQDIRDGRKLTDDEQKDLLRMLYQNLECVYSPKGSVGIVEDEKLGFFVGTDQCVVITTEAGEGDAPRVDDKNYGDIDKQRTPLSLEIQSMCYEQTTTDGILTSAPLQFLGPFLDLLGGRPSVLNGTVKLQQAGFPGQAQALMCWTGTKERSKLSTGLIFQTDRICDDAPLTMCLAASRAQWHTATKGTADEVIAVYGGQLITDSSTLARIKTEIRRGNRFKAENSLFGILDPWYGSKKSCCIMYSQQRDERGGEGLFWVARFGREGDEMDFALDILSLRWCGQYLQGVKFRQAYAALVTARLGSAPFRLDIERMPYLKPDPQKGVRKRLEMEYRSMSATVNKLRNIWEDHTYMLTRDIDWLIWEGWRVDIPEYYPQFFDRVDGLSKQDMWVGNELFGGRDPAVGRTKCLRIRLRSPFGREVDVSKDESKWLDLYNARP